jgi:acyl carrier protein
MVPAMTDEIVQKVLAIVVEEADVPADSITLETTFVDLGVDSLDFLCIINRIRNEVGPIPDSVMGSIEKVIDLAAAIGVSVN